MRGSRRRRGRSGQGHAGRASAARGTWTLGRPGRREGQRIASGSLQAISLQRVRRMAVPSDAGSAVGARYAAISRSARSAMSMSSGRFMIPADTRAYDTLYGELVVRMRLAVKRSVTSSAVSPATSKQDSPPQSAGSRGVCSVSRGMIAAPSRNAPFSSATRAAMLRRPIVRCNSTAAGTAKTCS